MSIDHVSQYPNHKEEMMKKFIFIIVAFMLMLIFVGCATMTPEQRKETYDLRSSVGNRPFVGESPYGVPGYGWGQLY